jgi:hypothetical protein
MHCNDVVRQLAARTDDQVPAILAEHLAHCTACSEWAKRAAQLDRLWEATRAPDPSPQAWENVWDRIALLLDSSTPMRIEQPVVPAGSRNGSSPKIWESVVHPSAASRPRRRSVAAASLLGLAQAAAVLFAISLAWQFFPFEKFHNAKRPGAPAGNSEAVDAALPSVDIEEGSLVLIRSEGEKPEVLVLTSESSPFGIDEWLLVFNKMESLAPNPVVAMKE